MELYTVFLVLLVLFVMIPMFLFACWEGLTRARKNRREAAHVESVNVKGH